MKKKLLILACVAVVAAGVGYWRLGAPFRIIRELEARYRQVQRGMSRKEVEAIMSYAGSWSAGGTYFGWDDDTAGPAANAPRIIGALAYAVQTWFLPVTFEFTFDEKGNVVGKHRFD